MDSSVLHQVLVEETAARPSKTKKKDQIPTSFSCFYKLSPLMGTLVWDFRLGIWYGMSTQHRKIEK